MPRKNKELRNNKGFTSVELLITLAISSALLAIAIPQFSEYKQRSYDAETKVNLHHLFASCKAYWVETLSSNNCSMALATQASYGFIESPEVVMSINTGAEGNFEAQASHTASANTYTINSAGNISLQ